MTKAVAQDAPCATFVPDAAHMGHSLLLQVRLGTMLDPVPNGSLSWPDQIDSGFCLFVVDGAVSEGACF